MTTNSRTLTKAQALRIVEQHSTPITEFLEEEGDHESYNLAALLSWLGY
jgi:hypothetical protein